MKSPFIICIAVLVILSSIPMVSAEDSILDILYKDIFGGGSSDNGGITPSPTLSPDIISGKVPLKEGITETKDTKVDLTSGDAAFTDKKSGAKVSTSVLVDNQKFVPETSAVASDELVWSSDKVKDSNDYGVIFTYKYTGTTLKETIVLKKETDLKFPVTVNDGYKLIPWDNGQWKIVSAISPYTMDGIVALKPSGIDADGKEIPMEYKWDGSSLNLVYNKTVRVYDKYSGGNITPKYKDVSITYPLTIDPTWVSYLSHWIDNTTISGTTIEMWNATGSTTWTVPSGVSTIDIFIVAGAGSAAMGQTYQTGAGGGGAGGVLNGTLTGVSGTKNIVVGSGGAGVTALYVGKDGNNGENSSFDNTYIAIYGGKGGYYYGTAGNGGSAGGGYNSATATQNSISPLTGYGNNGGVSGSGGAGGGAGSAASGNTNGTGFWSNITGTNTMYAWGGYGGSAVANVNGINSLGNGGQGGWDGTSGVGGSGVVIIRYTTPSGASAPAASFTVDRTVARIPKAVTVTDTSTNTPTSWQWQWGDGTANSTTQNPTHLYTKRGKYSIAMTATNAGGSGVATTATVRVVGYANE